MVLRKSKRGTIADLAFIMGVLLFFGVLMLVGYKFINEFNAVVQTDDTFNQDARNAVGSIDSMFPTVMDNSFLLLMGGLLIATLILAMAVAIHPIFFVFYFILLTIVIFLGGVFSNIYQRMAEQPDMAEIANNLVFTSHILEFLPIIIGVFGFVIAIVMFRTYQNAT